MIRKSYKNLSKKKKNIVMATAYIVTIFLAAFILNSFFYSPVAVVGISMNPALEDKDLVIVDKIVYKFREPERYEMVIFPYRYNNSLSFIKRIVGLPGEKVEIRDNRIYIDDQLLDEYYGIYDETVEAVFSQYGPVILEEDQYFVMGDNRNHSDDSRSEDVGILNKDDITGRICLRIWPFNSIGSLRYQ